MWAARPGGPNILRSRHSPPAACRLVSPIPPGLKVEHQFDTLAWKSGLMLGVFGVSSHVARLF